MKGGARGRSSICSTGAGAGDAPGERELLKKPAGSAPREDRGLRVYRQPAQRFPMRRLCALYGAARSVYYA